MRIAQMLGTSMLAALLTSCSPGGAGPTDSTSSGATSAPVTASSTAATASTAATLPTNAQVVVIDPGHNGGNSGATEEINRQVPDGNGGTKPCNTVGTDTNAGYPEHAFTWAVALAVRDLLVTQGIEVILTRSDDEGVGPCVDQRAEIVNRAGADAFVSIHADGSEPDDRGFHVITSSLNPAGPEIASASDDLAIAVRDAMASVLPSSDYAGTDGFNSRNDLAGLNLNLRPAIYIECGNMRNATDAELLSGATGALVVDS